MICRNRGCAAKTLRRQLSGYSPHRSGERLCQITARLSASNCKTVIKRWLPPNAERCNIECWGCMATYNMSHTSDRKVCFEPRQWPVPCVAENCETENYVWEKDVSPGMKWECLECDTPQKFAYGAVTVSNNEETE